MGIKGQIHRLYFLDRGYVFNLCGLGGLIKKVRDRVAFIVPFAQLVVITIAGTAGVFKLKGSLDSYLIGKVPPLTFVSADSAYYDKANELWRVTASFIKNRCILMPVSSVSIMQGDNTYAAPIQPLVKLRPLPDPQVKTFVIKPPQEIDRERTSYLSVDLPYRCRDGVEVVFLDLIDIPAFEQ